MMDTNQSAFTGRLFNRSSETVEHVISPSRLDASIHPESGFVSDKKVDLMRIYVHMGYAYLSVSLTLQNARYPRGSRFAWPQTPIGFGLSTYISIRSTDRVRIIHVYNLYAYHTHTRLTWDVLFYLLGVRLIYVYTPRPGNPSQRRRTSYLEERSSRAQAPRRIHATVMIVTPTSLARYLYR